MADTPTPQASGAPISDDAPIQAPPAGDAMPPATARLREALQHVLDTNYRGNQAALARTLGVDPPRISDWKNRTELPRMDALQALGQVCGVSVDWILFGDGAMYRDQWRTPAMLEFDLAEHVQRDAEAALRQECLAPPDVGVSVDGLTILREITATASARAVESYRRILASDALLQELRTVQRGIEQLEQLAARPLPPEKQPLLAAEVHRLERSLHVAATDALQRAAAAEGVTIVLEPGPEIVPGYRIPRVRGREAVLLRRLNDEMLEQQGSKRSRPARLYDLTGLYEAQEQLAAADAAREADDVDGDPV